MPRLPERRRPIGTCVCTHVVIRAYRQLGIDLPKLVHEDMRDHWNADRSPATGTPLVIHNIGSGTRMEDVLFAFTITGHFRYPG